MRNVGQVRKDLCTKDIFKNDSGLTLVEVMIVSGLLLVLGLGFATLMTNVGKQQKKVERDADIVQMQNNVRSTAGSPQALGTSLNVMD